jgi:hypothetical protein
MQVTLFTKLNCQLCDAIKYELMDLQSEYDFCFREEFVASNQDAQEREPPLVPAVDIERADGAILSLDFPVKQTELRRAIHAEMMRQSGGQK